jgi:hypothetical protein
MNDKTPEEQLVGFTPGTRGIGALVSCQDTGATAWRHRAFV